MEEVLSHNVLGRIGCHDAGRTYVVPITYVFDGKDIIAHSVAGLKVQMMRNNPMVCFEVDEVIDYTNWKSVIIWGEFREITATEEKNKAMQYFVDRLLRMKISETAIPPESAEKRLHPRSPGNIRPVIYRIIIHEMTGKYEKS